jgi:putative redox protein
MRVDAGDGTHSITMDYPMPGDDTEMAGLTPLRTLLASLAACSATSVGALLRKMRQPIARIEVDAVGRRRDEHSTVITKVALAFVVHGDGVDAAAVERALALSEEQICPVWAMLKPGTPVTATYRIEAA